MRRITNSILLLGLLLSISVSAEVPTPTKIVLKRVRELYMCTIVDNGDEELLRIEQSYHDDEISLEEAKRIVKSKLRCHRAASDLKDMGLTDYEIEKIIKEANNH